MSIFDFIVIGRGLIGSAAARHLAIQGANVALVGPSEPTNLKTHTGVFSSHYDSARIVRILDSLAHNCKISKVAIERFKPLEKLIQIMKMECLLLMWLVEIKCQNYYQIPLI